MTAQTRVVVSIITAGAVGSDEAATRWILARLSKRPGVRAELLELRDFRLPIWGPPSMPVLPTREHEVVTRWRSAIDRSDGFMFHVPPEHEGSRISTLMDAMEWAYPAWTDKAVAFGVGAGRKSSRVVQQLRTKAAALRMIVARSELRMPAATRLARNNEADETIDELLWWTQMLKAMRQVRQTQVQLFEKDPHPSCGG